MNKAIKQLRDELEKREKYWRDWNGRAANRNAKLEARIEELEKFNNNLMSISNVAKLQKRVEELENPWISAAIPPNNAILVLGYDEKSQTVEKMYRITWFSDGIETPVITRKYEGNASTHWQPLPPPLEKDND